MFDVIVIGGGVVGGLVLRELSRYNLKVGLVEKAADVCMGASKANSGIVHAGFDAPAGSLKAKFNVLGNKIMPTVARELGVKYKNVGSLVVAFDEEQIKTLQELKQRGEENGVCGLEIIGREALLKKEKNIADGAIAALFAPSGGIICPYGLTVAAIGNAMDNGASLLTDFDVADIRKDGTGFLIRSKNGKEIASRVIVNCAGAESQRIASLVGDDYFTVGYRRGEYILLDRECGDFVSHTLFFTPTQKGKGILITPTVDGNILLGPTAENMDDFSTETSASGLGEVMQKAKEMCNNVSFASTITSFAGVRAYCDRHDFILEKSPNIEGVIHCAGIESPGLTSAPAIAEYVVNELISTLLPLEANKNFNPIRRADGYFKELSAEQKNQIISKNPAFGKIVCRCEQITEGEIIEAIHTNPPATTVDGVKRRTRAGMGRCQGGFCQPAVAAIIARETGVRIDEVTKNGAGSSLLTGVSK